MRTLVVSFALICGGLLFLTDANLAQEKGKKDLVLKGKITCAKCDLGTAAACQTVIVVKDEKAKKDIIYYFDKTGHKKFHDDICSAPKNGTVEGTVKDDGKKKTVTVKKVTYE